MRIGFVGEGTATFTYTDEHESVQYTVEVVPHATFSIVVSPMPGTRAIPIDEKAVAQREFRVAYADSAGQPLFGQGLATATIGELCSTTLDLFCLDQAEGPEYQVEVDVGGTQARADFEFVPENELVGVDIVQTPLGDELIRVDGVGLTADGLRVWGVPVYFELEGTSSFWRGFDYRVNLNAPPQRLLVRSFWLPPGQTAEIDLYGTPVDGVDLLD